jgi:anti-anti-sigma regulatory factor
MSGTGDDGLRTEADDSGGTDAELVLAGRAELVDAATLRERALAVSAAGGHVIVQCGELETIDYASLQVLGALHETLRRSGRSMVVMNIPPSLAPSFGWMGLETSGELWDEPGAEQA